MRIAQVAPLYECVPPKLYGGTERVVSYLTEELVRRGHEVALFASGDSQTAAKLVAPCRRALRLDETCVDVIAPHMRMLGWVYRQADRFDVIHCHTDYLGMPLAEHSKVPTLLTLHGRVDIPEAVALYYEYPEIPLVSISDQQRLPLPYGSWMATVYHGLPIDLHKPQTQSGKYLLFVGRISPEKCPDTAIRVAIRAGVPLRIAAKVDPSNRDYFNSVIKPLLKHPLIEFIGEVDERQKGELLGEALALLFPINWPEPFGLVMIEALACGTPVIARSRGSVREILRHGKTGLLCETEDDMVKAVSQIGQISRRDCRLEFEQRFTVAVMADRYERLYLRLVQQRSTHEESLHERYTVTDVAKVPRLSGPGAATVHGKTPLL